MKKKSLENFTCTVYNYLVYPRETTTKNFGYFYFVSALHTHLPRKAAHSRNIVTTQHLSLLTVRIQMVPCPDNKHQRLCPLPFLL